MADSGKGAAFLDAERARKPRMRDPVEYIESLEEIWDKGLPPGDSTGWPDLDTHYTVMPGQMTIVTGWPSAGKSEFMDALLVNLARQNWKFAMFSFENQPVTSHLTKLIEKYSRKPYGDGVHERVRKDEIREYIDIIRQSFHFAETTSGSFSIAECLEAAGSFINKFPEASRGVVIDPWNELASFRAPGVSETEHIGQCLSLARNWARSNNVHVWIVAHPQKMPREEGKLPIPRPDMISGSQHWWNKADACLCVYRDLQNPKSEVVQIHIQKIRFKHIGHSGMIELRYNKVNGIYEQIKPYLHATAEKKRDLLG